MKSGTVIMLALGVGAWALVWFAASNAPPENPAPAIVQPAHAETAAEHREAISIWANTVIAALKAEKVCKRFKAEKARLARWHDLLEPSGSTGELEHQESVKALASAKAVSMELNP
jgi:hypothetical protein